MLDIKRIRQEPELIKERLQARNVEANELIDSLLGCDEKRRLIETEKQSLFRVREMPNPKKLDKEKRQAKTQLRLSRLCEK